MSAVTDAQVITRSTPTRFEPLFVDPERFGKTVNQSKREWGRHTFESTLTSTSTAATMTHAYITSPSLGAENEAESAAAWQKIDWSAINPKPAVVSTRATTPTTTTISSLRSLLRMQLRDDRLRRMSPERWTLYERIRKLRDKIKPIDFDAVEALPDLGEDAWLSADLLDFCSRHGILSYLPVALDSIETCFSSMQELHLQPEHDPETSEEWLVLDVTIQGDEEKVLDAYGRYIDRWVSAVPWPERNKIRLSYNII